MDAGTWFWSQCERALRAQITRVETSLITVEPLSYISASLPFPGRLPLSLIQASICPWRILIENQEVVTS